MANEQRNTPASCTAQVGRGGSGDFASSVTQGPVMLEPRFVAALSQAVSVDRLAAFVTAASQDNEWACRLYLWDRDLASTCLRDIAIVEVALRNALSRQLELILGSAWYLDRAFDRDHRLKNARDRAIADLRIMGKRPSSGLVTAQLSLGFWVNLLHAPSDPLWRQGLHRAFPGGRSEATRLGERYTRTWVVGVLETVRVLRNRCAHHEPLLRGFPLTGQATRLSATQGIEAYNSVTRMIDRNLADWMTGDSQTKSILADRPQAMQKGKSE